MCYWCVVPVLTARCCEYASAICARPHVTTAPTLCQELDNLPEARANKRKTDTDCGQRGKASTPPATYKFRLYSGKVIELFSGKPYRLDGQPCKGLITDDDFCNVS